MCWAQLCPRLAQHALGFEHVCCYLYVFFGLFRCVFPLVFAPSFYRYPIHQAPFRCRQWFVTCYTFPPPVRLFDFMSAGRLLLLLLLRRTSTASSWSQWSLPNPNSECSPPDLNCKLAIALIPAGPEQQAPDQSNPCRTSTASARSQWSPPDPNSKPRIRVVPAGP